MGPTKFRASVTGYLQPDPEVDAAITVDAAACDPTLAAVEGTGLGGKIKIGSFDLLPTLLKAIDEGRADCAIAAPAVPDRLPAGGLAQPLSRPRIIPVNNVMTGPLFVSQKAAKQVIEPNSQGYR